MVVPDQKILTEAVLYSNGFQDHKSLSVKISILLDLMKTQVSHAPVYIFSFMISSGVV
jgi:hypothetical protein